MISRIGFCLAVCASLMLPAGAASAGGMVSSGGELLRDANNPWWVKNTARVSYCIEIDQKSISMPAARIAELVELAIAHWKSEFSRPLKIAAEKPALNPLFNQSGVGTQVFAKIACTGGEDLRFKFGYGTLTPDQRGFIPNLSAHVSAAVRTEYDLKLLKGKGFVYIASDLGPNRYQGNAETIEKPWRYEAMLYFTVLHELGHVFGLPHQGSHVSSVMSAQFVEFMLNAKTADHLKIWKVGALPPYFFFPSGYFVQCWAAGFDGAWGALPKSYFSIPAGMRCLHFSLDGDRSQILVHASAAPDASPVYVGRIADLFLSGEVQPAILIYLTDAQTVFPKPTTPYPYQAGPYFVSKAGSGNFYPATGAARPLHLEIGPVSFRFVGVVGASLLPVLKGPVSMFPYYQ